MELQPWLMLTRTISKRSHHFLPRNYIANAVLGTRAGDSRKVAVGYDTSTQSRRKFTSTSRLSIAVRSDKADSRPSKDLSHNVSQEEKDEYKEAATFGRARQIRTPWQRDGPDTPPAEKDLAKGAMSEGKVLTTPSRMLKLILPLVGHGEQSSEKDVEPLALVVHPQQPLSYVERLIQAEIPPLEDRKGKDKMPAIYFCAQNRGDNYNYKKPKADETETETEMEDLDVEMSDAAAASATTAAEQTNQHESGRPSPGPVAKSSSEAEFVRWSSSTEIGDFIRDAAPVKKFFIEIEGAPQRISVVVPTFEDRSHYLRMRLRKISKKIAGLADIKRECDAIAHRSAQRVATGGFVVMCAWWYIVYRLTFLTDLGWDVMEPVTYLVGLSTLMGGYVWFLTHNREVSYRSAMNFAISRKQDALYKARGLDLQQWEALIEEGNALRREIKAIASEYDAVWDETEDAQDHKVVEELKKKREKEKERSNKKDMDLDEPK